MNLTNDAFGYMLTFLDIDSIAKLAVTCKAYNILCKKHTLYSKLLVMNMNKISINVKMKYTSLEFNNKYAIIYQAMKLGEYDVLKYYYNKYNLNENLIRGCFRAVCKILSSIQMDSIINVFPFGYFNRYSLTEITEITEDNNTKKIDLLTY